VGRAPSPARRPLPPLPAAGRGRPARSRGPPHQGRARAPAWFKWIPIRMHSRAFAALAFCLASNISGPGTKYNTFRLTYRSVLSLCDRLHPVSVALHHFFESVNVPACGQQYQGNPRPLQQYFQECPAVERRVSRECRRPVPPSRESQDSSPFQTLWRARVAFLRSPETGVVSARGGSP
jgi:hypothetical protein